MKLFIEPLREVWQELASRPSGDNPVVELRVSEIISYVKQEGDKALYSLTQKYDGVELKSLYADKGILTESESGIDNQLKRSIDTACENIEKFHIFLTFFNILRAELLVPVSPRTKILQAHMLPAMNED